MDKNKNHGFKMIPICIERFLRFVLDENKFYRFLYPHCYIEIVFLERIRFYSRIDLLNRTMETMKGNKLKKKIVTIR